MSEDVKAFEALKKATEPEKPLPIELGDVIKFDPWEEAYRYYGALGEGIVLQVFNKEIKSQYGNNFVAAFKFLNKSFQYVEIRLEVKTKEIILVRKEQQ